MTGNVLRTAGSGLAAAVLCAVSQAGALQNPFAEKTLVIRARRVITVSGKEIENGAVVIRGAKITSVGKDPRIPAGARVITANTIMPGIVGAYSQIGLSSGAGPAPAAPAPPGIPPQIAARFGGAGARAGAAPHLRVMDELYPYHPAYRRLPQSGLTTLALVPEGRGLPGQGVVIRALGDTAELMAVLKDAPFSIGFQQDTATQDLIRSTLQGASGGPSGGAGTGTETGSGEATDSTVEDADQFQRRQRRTGPAAGGGRPAAPSSLTLNARRAAVARAVGGDVTTIVTCSDAAATLYALGFFQSFDKLKPVYVLPGDCYRIARQLGEKKASVVVPAEIIFEANTRRRVNPAAELVASGVKVACRPPSDSAAGYEGLLARMAELVKYGLDRDAALKAITLSPAEMLGLGERVGCLEFGHDANVLFLDGDPLSPTTRVTGVMLEGKMVTNGR